jgi:hypothetical protein
MMNWVIAELRYRAPSFKETGMFTVYNGDVVKSDAAVSASLKNSLKRAVEPLENGPEKDYHPGSDDKVLDLIHPSLFPLVYGRSRILRNEVVGLEHSISNIGSGEILPVAQLEQKEEPPSFIRRPTANPYSVKFQWLPCDVELNSDSGCKIASYINNLHPQKHKDLYHVVEEIITCAIPLWNVTLTPQDHRYRYKLPYHFRIRYESAEYEDNEDSEQPSDEDDDDYWERMRSQRVVIKPEPGEFTPPKQHSILDLRKDNQEHGLQVIVKLANIHLTPEKPEYEGGSWHVEGQLVCLSLLGLRKRPAD